MSNSEFISRQAHLEQLKAEQAAAIEELNANDAEMRVLELQIAALKRIKTANEQKRYETHKAIKSENELLDALKRRLALEAENARLASELEARSRTMDEATANAVWRKRILPHQLSGAHYLASAKRAICADKMGLGKTFQAGVVMDMLHGIREGGYKTLIVCPGQVIQGFENEFTTWFPERVFMKLGGLDSGSMGTPAILEAIEFAKSFLVDGYTMLINYEILARKGSPVLAALIELGFDTVILDEAHRVKETDKPTFKAIKKLVHTYNICPICSSYSPSTNPVPTTKDKSCFCPTHGMVEGKRSVENIIPMTGTPILNRPDELFALLNLVDEELFPSLRDFFWDFCIDMGGGKHVWQRGGESRLVAKIAGKFIGRNRLDAGVVLPPQSVVVHEIPIDDDSYPLQTKFLRDLVTHSQVQISELKSATIFSMLPLITRMRQGSVWPGGVWMDIEHRDSNGVIYTSRDHVGAGFQESAKLDAAIEMAREFTDSGERWAVCSQFVEPLLEFQRRYGDKVTLLVGSTNQALANEVKRNFDRQMGEEAKWDGVGFQYTVGGEGLNLTAATQLIVLDEQWNPGKRNQAYARLDRMGQTESTTVHVLRTVGPGAIDKWLADLIEDKEKIIDGFETEISFSQLKELFDDM